jgi:FolB domain-containing protein
MKDRHLDRIHVRGLKARCIVGIREWEKKKPQEIEIGLTLRADLSTACTGDDIADTVDYKALKDRVLELAEGERFNLIEHLAQRIADLALADERVERVDVFVDKLKALRFAQSVGIEITRERARG